jgi:hypothetical protein
VREVFPELEGQGFFELLDQVRATGKPFKAEAMPIRLVAENEHRYIDLLYEPIRNDNGEVTGIFVSGYDVTDCVRGEARRETLARLTDKIHDLTDPDDIAFTASAILGQALKVSRVGYGAIDPDPETLEVVRDWIAPGVETLAGVVPLRAYGSFIDSLKRGEFIDIAEVEQDERTTEAADALKSRSSRSFVNVPLLEHGAAGGRLFVNHDAVRVWSSEDLALIREVAARTRVAVERSRNEAALRDLNATLQNRIAAALADKRWKPWVNSPAASRTTSTICWPASPGRSKLCSRGGDKAA